MGAIDPRRGAPLLLTALLAAGPAAADVAPSGWPTYGGSFANTRRAELTQITPGNVSSLRLAWTFATGVYGIFESSPIVANGTLYFTTGRTNTVLALDAATGALRWRFTPKLRDRIPYIMEVNRGVAVSNGRVFLATLDDRLIALDARTGRPVWNVAAGDLGTGQTETMAPLCWNGLVFLGSSGGEYGIRGSFSAYSAADGRLVWRWWSVSPGWEGRYAASVNGVSLHRDLARERADARLHRDSWRHGGGPVWMTPALSPADGAIYLSTGNPAPNYNGASRPGDNLYTDSIVALDARTGRTRWYYQETPHDLWDYDAASPPVLFPARDAQGRRVDAVGEAGKTGWFYILERRTGRLIRISEPFIPQPHLFAPPLRSGRLVQPGEGGGAIGPVAYDPALRSVFVAGTVVPERVTQDEMRAWPGGAVEWEQGDQEWVGEGISVFSRIDVDTGRIRWRHRAPSPIVGGALSVGQLVFTGEEGTGKLDAFDARSGTLLWQIAPSDDPPADHSLLGMAHHAWSFAAGLIPRALARLRGTHRPPSDRDIHAPPIAYAIGGREFVVVAADQYDTANASNGGDTLYAFTLPRGPR